MTHESSGAEWPLDKLTDAELSRRLEGLRERLSLAADAPGGSDEWRAVEEQIAAVMTEQADRERVRRTPVASLLVASELYAYCDRPLS